MREITRRSGAKPPRVLCSYPGDIHAREVNQNGEGGRASGGTFMRENYSRAVLAAAAAGGLALAGAAPAQAAPITAQVPCSTSALSSAITNAVDGDVLQLAKNCTYVLTGALPEVTVTLTIQGSTTTSTIARSSAGATPHFRQLTVGTGGDLTVKN